MPHLDYAARGLSKCSGLRVQDLGFRVKGVYSLKTSELHEGMDEMG